AEALRHVFFAERRAGRMLGAKAKAQKLERISIVGAAADAVALTREVLAAGYEVTLIDGDGDALAKGLESVAHGLASDLAAGKLSQTEYDAHWARVQPGLPGEDGDAADLVFVTGPYRHADAKVPGIAATSGAPIVTLGRVGTGGQRALGLVMMPPTQNGRLAEMLVTPDSDAETVATLLALLKRMRRSVIQGQGAGICAGLSSAFSKSLQVLEDKHGPEPVLEVLTRWGMVRDRDRHSNDPASLDLWSGLAAPMLGALANAGLRLYGDEAALRPSDIDLAMVLGLGFPRWGGGPMLWAARRGLLVLRDDLMEWEKDDAALWSPAPVLDGLIREGISLDALNDG
ncbi:MAG: hypothetical protein L0H65_09000, partial [Pseudorhodobacter sp.]|nr:hypothetical protein [Pseudorhodobacter sp.]